MSKSDPRVKELLEQEKWHEERIKLREITLACGLTEAVKWNQLCFTFNDKNVAIIFAMKAWCGLGFFKGALMRDPQGILYRQSEHSQASRLLRFTSLEELSQMEPVVKTYIHEAIEVEKSGKTIDFNEKHNLEYPDELQERLDGDDAFRAAFEALTPGRRRGYTLHFSGAKQSATRVARIEKHAQRILDGKGMHDR